MYTREDVYAGSLLTLLNFVRQNADRKKRVGERKCVCVLQHSLKSNCELQ